MADSEQGRVDFRTELDTSLGRAGREESEALLERRAISEAEWDAKKHAWLPTE